MTTTDEFIALTEASDQSALIDNIKARRLVLVVIQNDLRASTEGLSAVSGVQRCTAMHANISGSHGDRSTHCRRMLTMQMILDLFINDCLRGLTGCRSSVVSPFVVDTPSHRLVATANVLVERVPTSEIIDIYRSFPRKFSFWMSNQATSLAENAALLSNDKSKIRSV